MIFWAGTARGAGDLPEDIHLEETDKGYYLTETEKIAMAEYILSLQKKIGKLEKDNTVLAERIKIERDASDNALEQADNLITAKDEQIQALEDYIMLLENRVTELESENNRLSLYEKMKYAGGGAGAGALVATLLIIAVMAGI